MAKSLLDHAYDYMSTLDNPVSFDELWKVVSQSAGLSEEIATSKVARFYTNLMLDGRFVTLGENQWDLRSRHTYDKVHIDMKEVYSDVGDTYPYESDDSDEKEYDSYDSEEESNSESEDF